MEANIGQLTGGADPLLSRPFRSARTTADVDAVNLARIYAEHRVKLTNLAAAITLDRWLAEEVVQDAFTNLQQGHASIDNPVAYLHRAVVNRSISALRRRRVAGRHPAPLASPTVDQEIDETWHLVTLLPPRERAAVVLKYWLDLSETEIAEQLGWPSGTVKSTLHRALKRLRRNLT